MGWTHEVIAQFFSINTTTLRKAYKAELKAGKENLGCALTLSLAQQALKGKLPAIFFILKTQYGWRENVGMQPLGKNGEPIDINSLSTESLVQLLAVLRTGDGEAGDSGAGGSADGWHPDLMDTPARSTD